MSAGEDNGGMRLLVADSFRVRHVSGVSEARGFPLHVERFTASVVATCADAHLALAASAIDAYLADAIPRIAAFGEGNPRLELWGGSGLPPEFRLSLRPLPTLLDTLEARSARAAEPDLEIPTRREHKGVNIESFTALNRMLSAEALLEDEDGTIAEGSTTALIWWEGSEGFASASSNRVHSVTEQLVTQIGSKSGSGVVFTLARATAAELSQREVWAVNALHGIRPITSIDGALLPRPDPHRLQSFREALDDTWAPIV